MPAGRDPRAEPGSGNASGGGRERLRGGAGRALAAFLVGRCGGGQVLAGTRVDVRSREMPLLHRKPFVRQKPPGDLRPDEEVFYCKVTNEIFRHYDDFFERTILCNSLVWSCAVTGRPGLTYQEALESERKAKQDLQSFPEPLIIPVLYLTNLTHRSRLHEICDDIFAYIKDRYFVEETVEVIRNNGTR